MQNENLSQKTAEILQNMILHEHVYKSGEKLPNENELSEILGISRTTLREAIRILISAGILTVRRGRGTYVSEQADRYAASGVDMPNVSQMKITLRDLYETRMIFEPEAAALACRRATDAEIQNILELGEECQTQLLKDHAVKNGLPRKALFTAQLSKRRTTSF